MSKLNNRKLKITALAGLGDSGKSEILNLLIDNLTQDPNFITIIPRTQKKRRNLLNDFYALFENNKTSEKIYIDTEGDRAEYVTSNIRQAKKNDATYLITSCHVKTNVTQKPIFDEDNEAFFIATYKNEDWDKMSPKEQNYLRELYVNRLKATIVS